MKFFKVKLTHRIKRTQTIESFRFLPEEKISFLPGQFLQVIFDEQNERNKELNKYLSFSSSPQREYIEITKRLSESSFSQRLRNLKIRDSLLFKASLGNCVFQDNYKRIAFLVGGIGITPVISILEHIIDKGLETDILLYYSNRTEDEIAFRKELDDWSVVNKNLKILYTVTECKPSDDRCIAGRIDKDLVSKDLEDFKSRVLFTFGPPGMVNAMKNLCLEMGCCREEIMAESFLGY